MEGDMETGMYEDYCKDRYAFNGAPISGYVTVGNSIHRIHVMGPKRDFGGTVKFVVSSFWMQDHDNERFPARGRLSTPKGHSATQT